ncbi:MAG: DUF1810 domain-containing protein [Thermoleophilia bacterium]|nr:DUF1810 domain-containing protein [Thermoleophilia bacterium]
MPTADDPHNLRRFVDAQDREGTYETALAELRAGRKRTHWTWFVFPQIADLGQSPISQTYAIASLAEAIAYLDHPILGPRLRESAQALLDLDAGPAEQVLGSEIDASKLRSSMTLFARAAPKDPLFQQVLERYFGAQPDPETERRL